jgi:hypothetical protein
MIGGARAPVPLEAGLSDKRCMNFLIKIRALQTKKFGEAEILPSALGCEMASRF